MFLLLLIVLGAAGVKAQVRIGGNGAPNAAAVLDLNATDATTGTKGLALPRVALTSNTMQLTSGVVNLTGMLVYNTTATLGGIGTYYWNGTKWVQASLPSTSATDSGKFLMSDGNTWTAAYPLLLAQPHPTSLKPWLRPASFTMHDLIDTGIYVNLSQGRILNVSAVGLAPNDWCQNFGVAIITSGQDMVFVTTLNHAAMVNTYVYIRCWRLY